MQGNKEVKDQTSVVMSSNLSSIIKQLFTQRGVILKKHTISSKDFLKNILKIKGAKSA